MQLYGVEVTGSRYLNRPEVLRAAHFAAAAHEGQVGEFPSVPGTAPSRRHTSHTACLRGAARQLRCLTRARNGMLTWVL